MAAAAVGQKQTDVAASGIRWVTRAPGFVPAYVLLPAALHGAGAWKASARWGWGVGVGEKRRDENTGGAGMAPFVLGQAPFPVFTRP